MTMQGFKNEVITHFCEKAVPAHEDENLALWVVCALDIFRPAFIQGFFKNGDSGGLCDLLLYLYGYGSLLTRAGDFKSFYIAHSRTELP